MADCEPVPQLRDRLAADLRIKGQLSCPQKVDMRAIIPVYDFSPTLYSQKYFTRQQLSLPLDGLSGGIFYLLPPLPDVKYNKIKLDGLLSNIIADAAGRAAMAVAGSYVYVTRELYDSISGNYFRYGIDRWNIAASAGNNIGLLTGNRTIGLDINTAPIPAPDVQRMVWTNPIEIIFNQGNQLYLRIGTGPIVFPANTTLDWQTLFIYE